MLGFVKSASFVDPQPGELHRSRGAWRGTLKLDLEAPVPLVLSGGRTAPDAEALRIARSIPSEYASWRPAIERSCSIITFHTRRLLLQENWILLLRCYRASMHRLQSGFIRP